MNNREILEGINHWWGEAQLPEEALRARVVRISKKDSNGFANYRPISLPNIFFKLLMIMIHARIQATHDEQLQAMQYGFRKSVPPKMRFNA